LLGNGRETLNKIRAIARQPPTATIEELLGMVLSVGFAPVLYNKDPRPAEWNVTTDYGLLWRWGSNTSTIALRVVGGDEKGSLESETVKYGLKSHGTRTL
jgi:hypothetical protein